MWIPTNMLCGSTSCDLSNFWLVFCELLTNRAERDLYGISRCASMGGAPRIERRSNFEHFFAIGSKHVALGNQLVERFGIQFDVIRLAAVPLRELLRRELLPRAQIPARCVD